MVSVEAAVPAPGVMATGENEQLSPVGSVGQVNAMLLLKDPEFGFAVTFRLVELPAATVTVPGEASKETLEDPPQAGV
jgi:hypothetical protein